MNVAFVKRLLTLFIKLRFANDSSVSPGLFQSIGSSFRPFATTDNYLSLHNELYFKFDSIKKAHLLRTWAFLLNIGMA
jgi:hypothetical protein